MQLISLFSGIGGFELAAEWIGWDVIASCEINPFGQRVLKHYWPEAYHHDDIHTLNYETLKTHSRWDPTRPTILSGGFPCQPYSMAGKRRGKEDDRHLWPEMCRIIREIRPNYIVGENVLGLVSWDGGLVFDEVHSDLEAEGYEVQAVVIPAASVNAPHGRDRIWFCARLVANRNNQECNWRCSPSKREGEAPKQGRNGVFSTVARFGKIGPTPDTDVNRCSSQGESSQTERIRSRNDGKSEEWGEQNGNEQPTRFFRTDWSNFPTQSPICSGNDGLSTELDGITFSKWRNESIKAAGNAIVPQVAYSIFKAIIQCENKE